MAFVFWLKHPRLLLTRISYWLWEKRNPNKPWLCPGTIAFCELHLKPEMKALEFGSGRSTTWLAAMVGHVTSVEHNRNWFEQVRAQLAANKVGNVDYRLVPLNHPPADPERDVYEPVPDYVAVADTFGDKSLQLVLVDGHYRTHCIRHVIGKLAPRGYLLVDDISRWESLDSLHIPPDWRIADDSTNGLKRCIIWQAA